jgi:hypothetical protein
VGARKLTKIVECKLLFLAEPTPSYLMDWGKTFAPVSKKIATDCCVSMEYYVRVGLLSYNRCG